MQLKASCRLSMIPTARTLPSLQCPTIYLRSGMVQFCDWLGKTSSMAPTAYLRAPPASLQCPLAPARLSQRPQCLPCCCHRGWAPPAAPLPEPPATPQRSGAGPQAPGLPGSPGGLQQGSLRGPAQGTAPRGSAPAARTAGAVPRGTCTDTLRCHATSGGQGGTVLAKCTGLGRCAGRAQTPPQQHLCTSNCCSILLQIMC